MNNLAFFLYFLAVFPGFTALILCMIAYLRSKETLVLHYLLIMTPVSLIMFISLVSFFYRNVLSYDIMNAKNWLMIMRIVLLVPVVYLVPRFFHHFVEVPMPKASRALFLAAAALLLVSPFAILCLPNGSTLLFYSYMNFFPGFFYVPICYSIVVLFLYRRRIVSPDRRLFIKGFLIISSSVIPLLILEFYNNLHPIITPRYHFFFEYLHLSAWSSFYIYYLIRTQLLPHRVASGLGELGLTELAEPMVKLGLSEREREVAQLVLRGLSNKAIADRLFISLATVKTHVHNILDKSGCPSRVAFIGLHIRPGKPG